MVEQRKHIRLLFDAKVDLILDNGEIQPGRTRDISTGGTYIQTDPLPLFGTKITLLIDLPGVLKKCEIPCIVRWVNEEEGVGLQFEQLRPIEVWALNKLKHSLNK